MSWDNDMVGGPDCPGCNPPAPPEKLLSERLDEWLGEVCPDELAEQIVGELRALETRVAALERELAEERACSTRLAEVQSRHRDTEGILRNLLAAAEARERGLRELLGRWNRGACRTCSHTVVAADTTRALAATPAPAAREGIARLDTMLETLATMPDGAARPAEREDCPHYGKTTIGYGFKVAGTIWGLCQDCMIDMRRQLGLIKCDELHTDSLSSAEASALARRAAEQMREKAAQVVDVYYGEGTDAAAKIRALPLSGEGE